MQKLAWKKRKMEEAGEMGVGTLLIFIAMILVAAVAAGVLVQTAYKLQQQAEQTGNEALADVATGFKVLAVYGETVDGDDGVAIGTIHIKVALTAGSPDINVLYTIIEAVKTVGTDLTETTMQHVNATGSLADTYSTFVLRDMAPLTDAGFSMMTAGDVFQITIVLEDLTVDASLYSQEEINLQIMPKHGVPTFLTVVAPSTLPPAGGYVSLK